MMPFAALAALPASTLTLYRGAPIPYTTGQRGYASVMDTYLDATSAGTNHGGEPILIGGQGKTILIKFGDLGRVIPADKKVVSAKLELTSVGGEKPALKSIGTLKSSWGEGPFISISSMINKPSADGTKPTTPVGAATWQTRMAGLDGMNWRDPGANGSGDVEPVAGAKSDSTESLLTITNLAGAVQHMADHPLENHGFALTMSANTEFASSQNPSERPRLVLELEDAKPAEGADLSVISIAPGDDGFVATVKNVGTEPAQAFSYVWIAGGRPGATTDGGKALAPGETTTFTARKDSLRPGDGRFPTLALKVTAPNDVNPRNNGLEVSQGAKWIDLKIDASTAEMAAKLLNARGSHSLEDWVESQVSVLNDVYFDRSRFSFAPDGALERVAIAKIEVGTERGYALNEELFLRSLLAKFDLPAIGAAQVARDQNAVSHTASNDPYFGLTGWGDTRYEGMLPGLSSLSNEPSSVVALGSSPLEATGLLNSSEVAVLNARRAGTLPPSLVTPKAILIKAIDPAGRPLPNTELSFFSAVSGEVKEVPPVLTLSSGATGTTILPGKDGKSAFGDLTPNRLPEGFLVKATRNGITDWNWLKAWQLFDTANRGAANATILELRFNLPGSELDPTTNVAKERFVADSAKSLPAKLAALTDENPTTTIELPSGKGGWIEIDLARDRTVGDLVLEFPAGKMWNEFEVRTYATGQSADASQLWAREQNLTWTSAFRSESPTVIHYRGGPRRFRFIRIMNLSDSGGQVGELRAIPAVVAAGSEG